MNFLDIKTVLIASIAVELSLGFTLVILLKGTRSVPGGREWALAALMRCVSYFAYLYANTETLFACAGNAIAALAAFQFVRGALKIARRPPLPAWESSLIIAASLLNLAFAWQSALAHVRISYAALVIMLVCIRAALIIWKIPSPGFTRERVVLSVVLILWAVTTGVRGSSNMMSYLTDRDMFDDRLTISWFVLSAIMFSISSAAGFLTLTANRTRADLVRARKELADQLVSDALTGLLTRRELTARLDSEFSRARRYGHDLAILMIDCDNFKSVNDSYGHLTGDRVLNRIAGIIAQTLRVADLAGRFGGDEFLVALPETSKADAGLIAERIRESVFSASLGGSDENIRFSVSIGACCLQSSDQAVTALINRADEALLRAKISGRNRTLIAAG